MANGARMEGIEASLFFTFFGLYAIMEKTMDSLRVATVGNPAMRVPDAKGFPMPTILGAIPGMSAIATSMMKKEMEKLDIPPVREYLQMIKDAGGELYACKATVEMFHMKREDFFKEVNDVISVGQFYEKAAGGQIIFT
jgi:peroxiredoxin family protein